MGNFDSILVLNIIAALVIALLSGLGVGSGGLLVIWLTMVAGYSQTDARSLNLLFFLFSAGSALILHLLHKKIRLSLIAVMSIVGIIGALFGTYLGIVIDPRIVRKIFGGMLVFSGIYTLVGKNSISVKKHPTPASPDRSA